MAPRELLRIVLPPLLLAALMTFVAYAAAGATTGLFFAGVVIATLLTPPLVLAEPTRLKQLLCLASIVDGIAVVCLLSLGERSITLSQWFRAYVLLASYAFALWGVAALFRRLRFRTTIAQAITTTLFLTWLTWSIWLSPWIAGRERLVGILSSAHPLLALDAVLRATGPPWSERYFMYNVLTVLNQDVAYELPRGITPAVLLHGSLGAIALLLSRRRAVGLEVDVPDGGGGGARENRVRQDLLP